MHPWRRAERKTLGLCHSPRACLYPRMIRGLTRGLEHSGERCGVGGRWGGVWGGGGDFVHTIWLGYTAVISSSRRRDVGSDLVQQLEMEMHWRWRWRSPPLPRSAGELTWHGSAKSGLGLMAVPHTRGRESQRHGAGGGARTRNARGCTAPRHTEVTCQPPGHCYCVMTRPGSPNPRQQSRRQVSRHGPDPHQRAAGGGGGET